MVLLKQLKHGSRFLSVEHMSQLLVLNIIVVYFSSKSVRNTDFGTSCILVDGRGDDKIMFDPRQYIKLMFYNIVFLLVCTYLFANENGDLSGQVYPVSKVNTTEDL